MLHKTNTRRTALIALALCAVTSMASAGGCETFAGYARAASFLHQAGIPMATPTAELSFPAVPTAALARTVRGTPERVYDVFLENCEIVGFRKVQAALRQIAINERLAAVAAREATIELRPSLTLGDKQ